MIEKSKKSCTTTCWASWVERACEIVTNANNRAPGCVSRTTGGLPGLKVRRGVSTSYTAGVMVALRGVLAKASLVILFVCMKSDFQLLFRLSDQKRGEPEVNRHLDAFSSPKL